MPRLSSESQCSLYLAELNPLTVYFDLVVFPAGKMQPNLALRIVKMAGEVTSPVESPVGRPGESFDKGCRRQSRLLEIATRQDRLQGKDSKVS